MNNREYDTSLAGLDMNGIGPLTKLRYAPMKNDTRTISVEIPPSPPPVKPVAFTDNAEDAERQHGQQRERECNRFSARTPEERYWASAGWESGWDSAIRAVQEYQDRTNERI